MGREPQWASREVKVLWEPKHRWTVSEVPRPGRWAVFTRSSDGTCVGILETDDIAWVGFEGRGGAVDICVRANALIQTFVSFEYTPRVAFNLTEGLIGLEYGLTSNVVYGQLP